jgi:hypothetical protein
VRGEALVGMCAISSAAVVPAKQRIIDQRHTRSACD